MREDVHFMYKAIGMVEYKTISAGLMVSDIMLKTAQVEIIEAQTVCPGKYIVLLRGDLSAINACIEVARTKYSEHLIDHFVLGNPHESIFAAIYGSSNVEKINALGVLETFSAASIIVAADEAAKTAQVELIELRIARGMCGKSYLLLTGDVSAVEAAIAKAKIAVGKAAMLIDSTVIANPDSKLCKTII